MSKIYLRSIKSILSNRYTERKIDRKKNEPKEREEISYRFVCAWETKQMSFCMTPSRSFLTMVSFKSTLYIMFKVHKIVG